MDPGRHQMVALVAQHTDELHGERFIQQPDHGLGVREPRPSRAGGRHCVAARGPFVARGKGSAGMISSGRLLSIRAELALQPLERDQEVTALGGALRHAAGKMQIWRSGS